MAAYRIGPLKRQHQKNPRDILVKFPSWQTKSKVLNAFQENLVIEGSEITLCSDGNTINLNKRKKFRFLNTVLQQENASFKWGFPFKLIINYKNKRMIITRINEAELFLE